MGTRRDHAEHNEKLSLQLHEQGVFLDWACTTSFYTALHYVHEKILPKTYNGKNCKNLDDAVLALSCKNKHEATSHMVRITLPNIAHAYDFLMNASMTARYHNYEVDIHFAKMCKKKMHEIKAECI